VKFAGAIAVVVLAAAAGWAQSADPGLMAEIHRIRAIDNHSHPPRVVSAGEHDDEFDRCRAIRWSRPSRIR
jgi:hypothetical protein